MSVVEQDLPDQGELFVAEAFAAPVDQLVGPQEQQRDPSLIQRVGARAFEALAATVDPIDRAREKAYNAFVAIVDPLAVVVGPRSLTAGDWAPGHETRTERYAGRYTGAWLEKTD